MARQWQTLTLLVAYDPQAQGKPENWDWPALLDTDPNGVVVLGASVAASGTDTGIPLDPVAEYVMAVDARADRWVTGCMGTEEPCTRNGRRMLYVYNPATQQHGWLDLDTDVVTEQDPPNS
jgi:hypothetical protein